MTPEDRPEWLEAMDDRQCIPYPEDRTRVSWVYPYVTEAAAMEGRERTKTYLTPGLIISEVFAQACGTWAFRITGWPVRGRGA